jgi:hypothetical protein
LLGATPDKNRVVYLGIYNTMVNVSLAFSPYFSLVLFNTFQIRVASAIVGCMRICAVVIMFFVLYKKEKVKKDNGEANEA